MGREAQCDCNWSGVTARVKALIEPPDLILRGGLHRRLPLAALANVRVEGELLCFEFKKENISLALGKTLAPKWVAAIAAPPVTVAKKLGITPDIDVRMIGNLDDRDLEDALQAARAVKVNRSGDLIIARVNTRQGISAALKSAAAELAGGTPIWFVYPKGPDHPIDEFDVRSMGLDAGLVDTKVASVSARLTALRFVKRKNPQ
ncbi:DUF3052 domain-containing protein [Occallatibacter riparius]|uniref:DUF3052 domain-containing protein n=1 Tax=Occallatibacter riparius TaxID=1002689 RepID=A0A9J7BLJ5_9BACT|nr:DUF3052 domain-containing protein [Occallatibacter riparius]UWZ83337.1 DUF3052 domain-containing protein [Occallatibacter riparius]